jgi:hypothetical protein
VKTCATCEHWKQGECRKLDSVMGRMFTDADYRCSEWERNPFLNRAEGDRETSSPNAYRLSREMGTIRPEKLASGNVANRLAILGDAQ